jgi:hypothetical protein
MDRRQQVERELELFEAKLNLHKEGCPPCRAGKFCDAGKSIVGVLDALAKELFAFKDVKENTKRLARSAGKRGSA